MTDKPVAYAIFYGDEVRGISTDKTVFPDDMKPQPLYLAGHPPTSPIPDMPLRDWFAGMAMQAILPDVREFPDGHWRVGVALDAYAMADAMIKAREAK